MYVGRSTNVRYMGQQYGSIGNDNIVCSTKKKGKQKKGNDNIRKIVFSWILFDKRYSFVNSQCHASLKRAHVALLKIGRLIYQIDTVMFRGCYSTWKSYMACSYRTTFIFFIFIKLTLYIK